MKTLDAICSFSNAALMQTDVVRLSPDDTLREALDAMTRARVRHAVVEEDGQFLGLVSDRDLRLALPSRLDPADVDRRVIVLDGRRVTEVNIRRPYVAFMDGSAARSARLMVEKGVGCLPVLDPKGRAVGMLTLADYARVFAGLFSTDEETQPPRRPLPMAPRAA